MSCKYPEGNRSYKFCMGCFDNAYCSDSIISNVQMPEVNLPKDILPSASQANQMTKENIENCCTQELIEITKKIKNAISGGKFSISEDGNLKHESIERLKELGYKVETGCPRNEPYWSISWE